jgi:hypothetical protein
MLPASFPSRAATYVAGDVGLMFFLLRMAFWLGLVLILLPSGSSERAAPATEINASQAISAASATVGDLRQFCTRQPDACTVGSHVATELGYKAQAGAKMLYDFLTERLASKDGSKELSKDPATPKVTDSLFSGSVTPAGKSSADQASQNTLTPADLVPAWRAPTPHKSVKHSA